MGRGFYGTAIAVPTVLGGQLADSRRPMAAGGDLDLYALVTVYLKRRAGVGYLLSLIPAVFMLVMTTWGLILNEINFIRAGNWLLTVINAAVLVVAIWITLEGLSAFVTTRATEEGLATEAG